jgi:hypothetical protein
MAEAQVQTLSSLHAPFGFGDLSAFGEGNIHSIPLEGRVGFELHVLNQPIAFCRLEASPSCIATSPNDQKSISIAKTGRELITNLIGGLVCLNNPRRIEPKRAVPEFGYASGQKCACDSGPTSVVPFHVTDNISWHFRSNRGVLKRTGESAPLMLLVNLANDIGQARQQGHDSLGDWSGIYTRWGSLDGRIVRSAGRGLGVPGRPR